MAYSLPWQSAARPGLAAYLGMHACPGRCFSVHMAVPALLSRPFIRHLLSFFLPERTFCDPCMAAIPKCTFPGNGPERGGFEHIFES